MLFLCSVIIVCCLPHFKVFGIKGKSELHALEDFDLVEGVCIDYMHQIFLSITKRLMALWFESSNHSKPWYCGTKKAIVSKRICSINPHKVLQGFRVL